MSKLSARHRTVMGPSGRAAQRDRLVLKATPLIYPPPAAVPDDPETGTLTAQLDPSEAITEAIHLPDSDPPAWRDRAAAWGYGVGIGIPVVVLIWAALDGFSQMLGSVMFW